MCGADFGGGLLDERPKTRIESGAFSFLGEIPAVYGQQLRVGPFVATRLGVQRQVDRVLLSGLSAMDAGPSFGFEIFLPGIEAKVRRSVC